LQQEHIIYPRAIQWLCDGKVNLNDAGKAISKLADHACAALIVPHME